MSVHVRTIYSERINREFVRKGMDENQTFHKTVEKHFPRRSWDLGSLDSIFYVDLVVGTADLEVKQEVSRNQEKIEG